MDGELAAGAVVTLVQVAARSARSVKTSAATRAVCLVIGGSAVQSWRRSKGVVGLLVFFFMVGWVVCFDIAAFSSVAVCLTSVSGNPWMSASGRVGMCGIAASKNRAA